jgi:hypothetical protein
MRKLIVRMMSGLVLFGFITLLVGRLDNCFSSNSDPTCTGSNKWFGFPALCHERAG